MTLPTYLPVYFTQKTSLLSSHYTTDYFDYITTALQVSDSILIAGIFIGCTLVIASGLYTLKLKILADRNKKRERMGENRQPILLA